MIGRIVEIVLGIALVGLALRDVFDTVVVPGASGKRTAQAHVQHLRQRGGLNDRNSRGGAGCGYRGAAERGAGRDYMNLFVTDQQS